MRIGWRCPDCERVSKHCTCYQVRPKDYTKPAKLTTDQPASEAVEEED